MQEIYLVLREMRVMLYDGPYGADSHEGTAGCSIEGAFDSEEAAGAALRWLRDLAGTSPDAEDDYRIERLTLNSLTPDIVEIYGCEIGLLDGITVSHVRRELAARAGVGLPGRERDHIYVESLQSPEEAIAIAHAEYDRVLDAHPQAWCVRVENTDLRPLPYGHYQPRRVSIDTWIPEPGDDDLLEDKIPADMTPLVPPIGPEAEDADFFVSGYRWIPSVGARCQTMLTYPHVYGVRRVYSAAKSLHQLVPYIRSSRHVDSLYVVSRESREHAVQRAKTLLLDAATKLGHAALVWPEAASQDQNHETFMITFAGHTRGVSVIEAQPHPDVVHFEWLGRTGEPNWDLKLELFV